MFSHFNFERPTDVQGLYMLPNEIISMITDKLDINSCATLAKTSKYLLFILNDERTLTLMSTCVHMLSAVPMLSAKFKKHCILVAKMMCHFGLSDVVLKYHSQTWMSLLRDRIFETTADLICNFMSFDSDKALSGRLQLIDYYITFLNKSIKPPNRETTFDNKLTQQQKTMDVKSVIYHHSMKQSYSDDKLLTLVHKTQKLYSDRLGDLLKCDYFVLNLILSERFSFVKKMLPSGLHMSNTNMILFTRTCEDIVLLKDMLFDGIIDLNMFSLDSKISSFPWSQKNLVFVMAVDDAFNYNSHNFHRSEMVTNDWRKITNSKKRRISYNRTLNTLKDSTDIKHLRSLWQVIYCDKWQDVLDYVDALYKCKNLFSIFGHTEKLKTSTDHLSFLSGKYFAPLVILALMKINALNMLELLKGASYDRFGGALAFSRMVGINFALLDPPIISYKKEKWYKNYIRPKLIKYQREEFMWLLKSSPHSCSRLL